ncbi:MAG: S-layer homology domain-containing protein [Clostridia bacterium]|nr:S-layer homology domain-containing protein [Clostridia bacterium]
MKKKILTLAFVFCLVFLTALTASAMSVDKLVTNGGDYGFEFEIKENGISVSGKVQNEEIYHLIISTDENYIVNITPDVKFTTTVKFPSVDLTRVNLGIFLGKDLTSSFTGVFFGEDIVLENVDGKWSFKIDDEVYQSNANWLSGYVVTSDYLNKKQPDTVKMVTASVINKLETDYEKARAIHRWIASNVFYDKDYALHAKTKTALTAEEVLTDRVTVCEGYANLAVAMLNSAGIPAMGVKGYALGVDTYSSWDEAVNIRKANHMWVEAFIDGKWIIMDPTWDSKNMYYNGKKEINIPVAYRYFDITPELLAIDYKIMDRPNLFGEMGISDWAMEEALSAYDKKLVIDGVRTTMKDKITREEFCDLIVNLLTQKLGKSTDTILEERELQLNYEFFRDRVDYNILVANALGIVNGKENNMFDASGLITRQEAAVMLQRTARVLGAETPNSEKITFADADTFPSWSADAIDFVSASVSSEGTRIMGGVEDNKFAPTGFYTKEQSVLTVYRLFNTY